MKRSLLAAVLIILPAVTACGRASLPDYGESLSRVDSLDISLGERLLEVRIFCSFGIGSCGLVFNEPLAADSVQLHLLYREGSDFSVCEGLWIVSVDADGDRDTLVENRRQRLDGGVLTRRLDGPVIELEMSWVDFYRS